MALAVGDRLGPYEVLSTLGAGGMGEVYRAHDATLKRDVALKILPDGFAFDPERLARFKREAQVLASLNHSNIAAIYGFEASTNSTSSGRAVQALILELVEGPTLADRIALGPIPVEEALPIARQIAEALEAAHEQGIVHRDLKPANVKLRPDGTVKVLDFGLAKTLDPVGGKSGDATASPTITSPAMTAMGLILGTAAYMSPEQAKGRQADKRSDVWAFGAVLYEMLSGQRAFKGDDVSDTLAAVLRQDVDGTALPASTPAPVRRLIARCLDRDVKRRLRDIGEARIVLDDPAALVTDSAKDGLALVPPRPLWRRAIPAMLAAIVAGGLAGIAVWYLKPSPPLTVTRLQFTLPEAQRFGGIDRRMIDISPDGTHLVYVASGRLYLRAMADHDAKEIQGTDGYQAVKNPVFSPDGRSVAFHAFSDQTLKKIAVTGGAAVTICPSDLPFGMSWGPDGIVFAQRSKGISRVSPDGGTPDVLVDPKDGEVSESPQMLPGGQYVLFTLAIGTGVNRWDSAHAVVQSIATGERKTIVAGADARYLATGHLVYAVGGSVFAVPFDAQRLAVTGSPVLVVAGVMRASAPSGAADFSISRNGTLIYVPGTSSLSSGHSQLGLTDRKGKMELLKLQPGAYVAPRVAPDGAHIAFGIDDGNEANIYTYHLSGASAMRRLTFGRNNRFPIWTGNNRVAFQSDREGDLGVWQSTVGGTAERLTKPEPGTSHVPESWSPKHDTLLFNVTKGSDVSLWTYSLQDRTSVPFGEVRSSDPTNAVFSPDGRWVAYTSTERNRAMIYVQPFPASGALHQLPVRANGIASQPLWAPDGKELFYNPAPAELAWVSVMTQPTITFGNPETVPRPFRTGSPAVRRAFDITPGGRFVGLSQEGQTESGTLITPQIQVVLNWFEELKRLVPAAK